MVIIFFSGMHYIQGESILSQAAYTQIKKKCRSHYTHTRKKKDRKLHHNKYNIVDDG